MFSKGFVRHRQIMQFAQTHTVAHAVTMHAVGLFNLQQSSKTLPAAMKCDPIYIHDRMEV